MSKTNSVDDFAVQLRNAKIDTEEPLAEIVEVYVDRRDAVPEPPGGEDRDHGLVIVFERPSGATMTEWFEAPETWEPHYDLVALLTYLHVNPETVPDDGLEKKILWEHVPVRHDPEDGWHLDWEIIADADLPERIFR